MENIDSLNHTLNILMWAIGGGFAGTWAMLFYLCKKIDIVDERLSSKIDKLSEKVEDIDRRLCRIEGALGNYGHCLYSSSNLKQDRKAE